MLLTDEEINNVLDDWGLNPDGRDYSVEVAKAQLKAVVEWGNEECWEHEDKHRTMLRKGLEEMDAEKPYFPRHFCYKCWQALIKEIDAYQDN